MKHLPKKLRSIWFVRFNSRTAFQLSTQHICVEGMIAKLNFLFFFFSLFSSPSKLLRRFPYHLYVGAWINSNRTFHNRRICVVIKSIRDCFNQIVYIYNIHSKQKTNTFCEMHEQIHPFTHQATMIARGFVALNNRRHGIMINELT